MDDGESLVSRKVHRLLRVPPTGSSASKVFYLPGARPGGPGKHQPTESAKRKWQDAMFRVYTGAGDRRKLEEH